MKQELKKLLYCDQAAVGLILIVSVLIISPVIFYGIPVGNRDFVHHLQIANSIYEAFQQNLWSSRWAFRENLGYGSIAVRLYPPLMHYTLAIFRLLTGNWQWAIFCGFAFWSFVGGLGIFLWTKEILTHRYQAVFAALLFVLSPYHLNQFYNSFMYGEFAALSVLPFAFYFSQKTCRRGTIADICGFAVSLALLVLSNLPQTIVGAVAVGGFILLNLENLKVYKQLGKLAISGILAISCSLFYLIRLINEMNWLHISLPNTDPAYDFRNHFLLHNFAFNDGGVWFASILFVLLMLLLAVSLLVTGKIKTAMKDSGIKKLLILTAGSVFMLLPISYYFWEIIQPLQKIQFPWRFLSILTITISILAAFSLNFINQENLRRRRPLILLLIGINLIFITFSVKQVALGAIFLEKENTNQFVENSITAKNLFHWLPVWANETVFDEKRLLSAGARQVQIKSWEPESREFSVEEGETIEARLGILFYPHWRASINGNQTEIAPTDDGVIGINLPGEKADVKLIFVEPKINLLAEKISLVVWLFIGSLLLYNFVFRKKSEI